MQSQTFEIGDIVSWNSEAGYVTGSDPCHTHHAFYSEWISTSCIVHKSTNPQYEIESLKTGHIAFHKGVALTLVEH